MVKSVFASWSGAKNSPRHITHPFPKLYKSDNVKFSFDFRLVRVALGSKRSIYRAYFRSAYKFDTVVRSVQL